MKQECYEGPMEPPMKGRNMMNKEGEKQFTLYKTLELEAICKRCDTVVYAKGADDVDLEREFNHLLGLHMKEGCYDNRKERLT